MKNIDDYYLFENGDILVTDMTTPDWEPIMKISSGIITNKGGRTCHAAIIAREMGLNAVVGTGNCTKLLENKTNVTLNCANGEKGIIYQGLFFACILLQFWIAATNKPFKQEIRQSNLCRYLFGRAKTG